MKIAVLIKQTPDTADLPKVSAAEASSGQLSVTQIINPWDEFAVEEAITLAERFDGDSFAITLGDAGATDGLKHALAMGVNNAVLVDTDDSPRMDSWVTAAALAGAVKEIGDVDIVLAGRMSVDGNSGVIYAGVASKLGFNLLTNVAKIVDVAGGKIVVERAFEGGAEVVSTPLPAVISVSKEINDPRYPSFMGIRKASRAKIPVLSISDMNLGETGNKTVWSNVRKPEERRTQVQIFDGATVQEKAAKLADALLAEKVI